MWAVGRGGVLKLRSLIVERGRGVGFERGGTCQRWEVGLGAGRGEIFENESDKGAVGRADDSGKQLNMMTVLGGEGDRNAREAYSRQGHWAAWRHHTTCKAAIARHKSVKMLHS